MEVVRQVGMWRDWVRHRKVCVLLCTWLCVRVKFLKQVINHVLYTRIHTHVYKHITVLVCAHTRTRICIKNFKHVNMHKQTHFKNIYRDINTKKSSKTYLYENRHS